MKYILKTFSEINKEIDFFIILHRDVQRQKGPNDCGLFVLAFLFALCEGKNPSLINFKQSEMRKHYTDCIEMENFLIFHQRRWEIIKQLTLLIYLIVKLVKLLIIVKNINKFTNFIWCTIDFV